jgi:hypothetical protein
VSPITERGIFVSYRREDSAGEAGRLYDWLTRQFGAERVFRDVNTLVAGTDFAARIEEARVNPFRRTCAMLRFAPSPTVSPFQKDSTSVSSMNRTFFRPSGEPSMWFRRVCR